MPGAPCAFVQEAAAGSTCAGCQQAELGTQLPPGLFTGVCGTASGTQGVAAMQGMQRTAIQQSCSQTR